MQLRLAIVATVFALAIPSLAQADTRCEALANQPFNEGFPTPEASRSLADELVFQRAVQSYLWSLPAINIWAMKEASEKQFGAGYNVLPTWKKRINAKTLVTTPNSDLVYAMAYLDLKNTGHSLFKRPLACKACSTTSSSARS